MTKEHLIPLIRYLGITFDEVIIDIKLQDGLIFNSIELRKNQIILHQFLENDLDIEFDYDEMPTDWQKEIYLFLARRFLN